MNFHTAKIFQSLRDSQIDPSSLDQREHKILDKNNEANGPEINNDIELSPNSATSIPNNESIGSSALAENPVGHEIVDNNNDGNSTRTENDPDLPTTFSISDEGIRSTTVSERPVEDDSDTLNCIEIFGPSGSKPTIDNEVISNESESSDSSSDNYDPENDSNSSSSSSRSSCSTCSSDSSKSDKQIENKLGKGPKKRKKNISAWKKNIRKKKRLKGEAYVGARNIERPARPMLASPCSGKPKHKCDALISEENRRRIYEEFRQMMSLDDQRNFLNIHIERKNKKRVTRQIVNSRRSFTMNYTFTVNGQKVQVCRAFFMCTLNVTDAFMRGALKKLSSSGIVEKEYRGKHVPHNKLKKNEEELIREHILSFPAVESHYCRSSSTKKYLDSTLNISIMHKMYKTKCVELNVRPVSFEKYRRIFKEYNLGFHKPKKDQCKKCLKYKSLTEEEKGIHEHAYQEHIERKKLARRSRDEDKEIAKNNAEVLSFNFDLEAVLTTPKGSTGQIFYLRKLAIYNFTIYNLGNQDGICYLWDESQGKRGSNEISSCIYNYIVGHPNITEVRMMSDGCGGQQRNSHFAAMCFKLLSDHPNLKTINHKYFETGHTEMECDSLHSKIEQKSKYVPVYSPEGWAQIIRSARTQPRPFEVRFLMFDDIFDFKSYGLESYKLNQIPWQQVCWLRYVKGDNGAVTLFYKKKFCDEFQEVETSKTRGRPKKVELRKAYDSKLPVAIAKYKDPQKMCNDLTIPRIYHDFYKSLKVDENIRDNLPEPDESEDSAEDY